MGTRNPVERFVVVMPIVGALVLLAAAGIGCSSSNYNSNNPTQQPTSYAGTVTGTSGTGGTLSLTITPAVASMGSAIMPLATTDTVSGTLHITGGVDVVLSGTFTPPSGPLDVSGGGYTFSGSLQNGTLSGTWTGPGSSGSFTALVSGSSGSVTNFCGTFSGSDSGTWDLSQSGMTLSGSYTGSGGSATLSGTLSGTSISLTSPSGATAQGTLSGPSMSGTWTSGSHTGTWQGSTSGCN